MRFVERGHCDRVPQRHGRLIKVSAAWAGEAAGFHGR